MSKFKVEIYNWVNYKEKTEKFVFPKLDEACDFVDKTQCWSAKVFSDEGLSVYEKPPLTPKPVAPPPAAPKPVAPPPAAPKIAVTPEPKPVPQPVKSKTTEYTKENSKTTSNVVSKTAEVVKEQSKVSISEPSKTTITVKEVTAVGNIKTIVSGNTNVSTSGNVVAKESIVSKIESEIIQLKKKW